MIDLGIIKPGSTLQIPFGSFTGSTGAPSATTGLATSDVLVYKDGGTTQRASASGFTVSADFDALTGVNLITIDLADNTTAGFWAAGSRYVVVIGDVTIDSQTVRFPLASFTIGLPGAVLNTTIASYSSATSFTLTAGPAEDDALNGCVLYLHDVASAVQGGFAVVLDDTGSTKTVTLAAGTTYTAAATDNVMVLPPSNTHWHAETAQPPGALPNAVAGAAGGVMIAGSNAATTLATLTVTGALSATNASNDLRLGATERGSIRDKVIERTTLRGTVSGSPSTTSIPTSAMSPATSVSNQLQGQILMFDHDTTTAALRGQKTDITASSASATPTLTVTALTTAPVAGDTFTIG